MDDLLKAAAHEADDSLTAVRQSVRDALGWLEDTESAMTRLWNRIYEIEADCE